MEESSGSKSISQPSSSDYRGTRNTEESNRIKPIEYIAKNTSYANIAQTRFPKNDQGILCEYKEGLILDDYLDAIDLKISANNIITACKSNNHFKIYFLNKEICEQFVNSNATLKIKDFEINIKPLSVQYKKIYLSNVSPAIPHTSIEEYLQDISIRRGSPVSHLGASKKYKHITSNRRIVYIHPDDVTKIPAITKFIYNGETSFFFATADNLTCFYCRQEGHIAKICPKQKEDALNNADLTNIENQSQNQENTMDYQFNSQISNKRAHSEISSEPFSDNNPLHILNAPNEESLNNKSDQMPPPKNTQVKKKKKKSSNSNTVEKPLDDVLAPIKNELEKPESIMNYITFKSFLENVKNSKNTKEIALKYSPDLNKLANMLFDLHPKLTDRGTKSRFTRIRKKLLIPQGETYQESSSEIESESEAETSDI